MEWEWFAIQYKSVKGNCEKWRHTWGTREEWEPCWADSDGHTFSDLEGARRALSAILARNPDFSVEDWRIVHRIESEEVID